ncbi:MAG: PAS domain S-box protein [Actinobacteria bacterium]|nr:MAG: PAS domain S-box protein [Actinomycetota bacterium]
MVRNHEYAMIVTDGEVEIVESSESKAIKAALESERDFTSAVLDTAGALVVVLDTVGRIVRFNRMCEKTTGYRAQEVEGRAFWDIFLVEEEIEAVRQVFEELRAGNFPNTHENYWLTKDGKRRLISWSNTALVDGEGKVRHVIATGVDVTERKEAEEAREATARQLQDANEELAATNEELFSTNEELTSANEELAVMNEELTSANEELAATNEEFAIVSELTESAITSQDINELVDKSLRRVIASIGADCGMVLLAEGERLVPQAGVGMEEEVRAGHSLEFGEGFAGQIARTQSALYVADAQSDPTIRSPYIKKRGVRSMLGVPMLHRGGVLGVLHIDWIRPHPDNPRDRRLLGIVADRFSLALQAAHLREQVERGWLRAEELSDRLRDERDILRVTMENTDAMLVYLDRDFNFLLVNDSYEASCGHPKEELLGRNHFEFFPDEENRKIFERARETGERVEFKAKPFEYADQPWRGVTYWDWSLTPIKNPSGHVAGFVFSLVDVTRNVRGQQMEESLTEINEIIHSTLDPDEIMRRVVVEAAETMLCQSTAIGMLEGEDWVAKYAYGPEDRLRSNQGRFKGAEVPIAVMAQETREPVVIEDVPSDRRISKQMQRFNIKSTLTVPLSVRDRVTGVLNFNYHDEALPFSDLQISFATKLASALSLALENARLFGQQQSIAETLQKSLLRPIPDVANLDVGIVYASAFESALVGGDFYDIFALDEGRVGVLIGDVSGKGIEAAGLTETIRSSVRSLCYIDPSPAFVFSRLNHSLMRQLQPDMFATAALLVLDTDTGDVRITSAGHPPPIIRAERCSFTKVRDGMLLGLTGEPYRESYFHLEEGHTIVLYTDGIVEARRTSGELFGDRRLLASVASHKKRQPQSLVNAMLQRATRFAEGKLEDDVALLALRLKRRQRGK